MAPCMMSFLSDREHRRNIKCLNDLKNFTWANPLLNKIERSGEPGELKNRSFLFEARFAVEINNKCKNISYEFKTGVGSSSVDFCIRTSKHSLLVELVTMESSEAVRSATKPKVIDKIVFTETVLSSKNEDSRESTAGELIKVQEKIGEKVFKNHIATKFKTPSDNNLHLIIVDMRGFEIGVFDQADCNQLMYGPESVKPKGLIQFWNTQPVRGLLEKNCKPEYTVHVRDKIHCIGFVSEENYSPGEIPDKIRFFQNPILCGSTQHDWKNLLFQ